MNARQLARVHAFSLSRSLTVRPRCYVLSWTLCSHRCPSHSSVGTLIRPRSCQILLDLLYLDWMSCSSLCSSAWRDPIAATLVWLSLRCVALSVWLRVVLHISVYLWISHVVLFHPSISRLCNPLSHLCNIQKNHRCDRHLAGSHVRLVLHWEPITGLLWVLSVYRVLVAAVEERERLWE